MGAISEPIRRIRKRDLARATRASLEETFRYWLENYAPAHFRRGAFGRYDTYAASRKLDLNEWRRRHAEDIARRRADPEGRPLVRTGKLQQAFLTGSINLGGSNTRLQARWPSLPRYATRPNRYGGFEISRALVEVTEAERVKMSKLFRDWVSFHLRNLDKVAPRSYGRYVIHI